MVIEQEYLAVVSNILEHGHWQADRTSVGQSLQLFGQNIKFDTQGRYAPLIQCRTFAPRISFYEWKWMINGMTDSKWLEERKIYIWKGNTTREFLDARGLNHLPEGEIGPAYGKQFRDFSGVDQLQKIFDQIKNDPLSRRHVISLWNVPDLPKAALEPCAYIYEFMVDQTKLHIHQHMRSADIIFGVPYDLSFAYFMLKSFADALGYETGFVWVSMTNAHIYKNQYDIAQEIVSADYSSYTLPEISLKKQVKTLDDICNLEWEDIEIKNWTRGPKIGNATMAI